jgi:uncharacterized lipoprotein YajG
VLSRTLDTKQPNFDQPNLKLMKALTEVLFFLLASFLLAACGEQKEQSAKTEDLSFQISGAT